MREEGTEHFSSNTIVNNIKALRKFVWVGYNKHFCEYFISRPLTFRGILNGLYSSFFSPDNINCVFVMEIFEGDTLIYHTKSSMSSMSVKLIDGVFVGEGPFNTLPLERYFNAEDFVTMEIELPS